jgi:hypothetical protein
MKGGIAMKKFVTKFMVTAMFTLATFGAVAPAYYPVHLP